MLTELEIREQLRLQTRHEATRSGAFHEPFRSILASHARALMPYGALRPTIRDQRAQRLSIRDHGLRLEIAYSGTFFDGIGSHQEDPAQSCVYSTGTRVRHRVGR